MTLRLIILFVFFSSISFSQDTLVLCQKIDRTKEYKIPLEQYIVRVKPVRQKKFSAFIADYKDSTLTFKVRQNNKYNREQVKKMYDTFWKTIGPLILTDEQFDSLMLIIKKKEYEIMYPNEIYINIKDLKKIKISNHDRPEKKRLMKNLETTALITLGAMLFSPITQSTFVVGPVYAFAIGFIFVDVILETERLNFKRRWTVKTLAKNNAP